MKNLVQYEVTGAEARVLARIWTETRRAIDKHGAGTIGVDLNRDLVKILEELGEAGEASLNIDVCDRRTPDGRAKRERMILLELYFEDEVVQVASLSIRLLVVLEKRREVRECRNPSL